MKLPVKKHLKHLTRIKNSSSSRAGFLRLDKNENTVGFPKEFIELLRRQIDSDFLTTYPELETLYKKVAIWVGCTPANLYISAGSDAAIKAVFEAFVSKGDGVALLNPTYAMFNVYTEIFQGRLIKMDYDENLSLSGEKIVCIISEHKPKLVCIANPNSPTGTVLSQKAITKILDTALQHGSIVLLDEAYYLFYPVTSVGLIERYPNLIVTRTFSKAFGLASARLGYACGHKNVIQDLHSVRPMYETNSFAAKFAEITLDNYHLVEEYAKGVRRAKKYLEAQLDALKIPYFKSFANFVLINVGSNRKTLSGSQALYKRRILVKAGFKDGVLKNCIRVTLGNIEQMKYFMKEFKEVSEEIR